MGSLLRLKSGVPGASPDPGLSLTLLPTEKRFVDVTDLISDAHDSNRITVAVTGTSGQIAASVWLHRTFGAGESGAYVARALKDHFCIETISATEGAVGEVTLTYYTGANNTGTQRTKTIAIEAAWGAVDSYTLGALSRAMVCGPDIAEWFPDPENWTVDSSSVIEMTIRADTGVTPATYRLTPVGAVNATVTGLSAAAGQTNVITLLNVVTSETKVINAPIQADQYDAAPRHSADVGVYPLATCWGSSVKRTGQRIVLENGNHYNNATYFDGFGGISVGAYARPSGPWAEGDNWEYGPDVTAHPGFFTITSRSPWGANLGASKFSITGASTYWGINSSQRIAGIRITNCRTTVNGQLIYDRFGSFVGDMFMVDHCRVTPPAGSAIEMRQNGATAALGNNRGNIFWSNLLTGGGLVLYSLDYVFINNRIEPDRPTQDAVNWVGCDSTQGVQKCQAAWNFWINKEGLDNAEHADDAALRAGPVVNPSYNDGPLQAYIPGDDTTAADNDVTIQLGQWWGNATTPGTPYVNGSGVKLLPGGEAFWNGDIPAGVMQSIQFCGNFVCTAVGNGIGFTNAGAGVRANYNTLLLDYFNFPSGIPPQFKFGIAASSTDIELRNNLTTGGLYESDDGGTPAAPISGFAPDDTGSVTGADEAWQTTHLANPHANPDIRDIVDLVDFYSYKTGQEVDAGCFADKAIIDFERHTVDKVALGLT